MTGAQPTTRQADLCLANLCGDVKAADWPIRRDSCKLPPRIPLVGVNAKFGWQVLGMGGCECAFIASVSRNVTASATRVNEGVDNCQCIMSPSACTCDYSWKICVLLAHTFLSHVIVALAQDCQR